MYVLHLARWASCLGSLLAVLFLLSVSVARWICFCPSGCWIIPADKPQSASGTDWRSWLGLFNQATKLKCSLIITQMWHRHTVRLCRTFLLIINSRECAHCMLCPIKISIHKAGYQYSSLSIIMKHALIQRRTHWHECQDVGLSLSALHWVMCVFLFCD